MEITIESLKQAYPEIIAGIEKEAFDKGFSQGMAKGMEDGIKTGAEKERERIKAVEENALPGHEKLIAEMKYDGKTTGEQAAVKILQAEKSLRSIKLDDYKADSPPVVDIAEPKMDDKQAVDESNMTLEEKTKKTWDKDAKLREEFNGNFESYKAYVEASEAGLVKIYKK
jgi:hypothetical protein